MCVLWIARMDGGVAWIVARSFRILAASLVADVEILNRG